MLLTLIFLTSLLMVTFSIPAIINLAFRKRLFDKPSELRKVHKKIVPNFGGIAIFSGFLFTCLFFIKPGVLPEFSAIMAGGLILFMIGLNDDIVGLGPLKKFTVQFISAFIVVFVAGIRIHSLHGFMGFGEFNYYFSIAFTVLLIVGVVNAFNLIDGIDGLAASLGVLSSLVYAYLFWSAGLPGWTYFSIALTGSLIGFLFFNVSPARIFMGDSGSLFIGFCVVVMSIKFIDVAAITPVKFGTVEIISGLGLVLSILIIPVFDTLRVFTLRIIRNRSPFKADSNHLHHRLLFLGLSHMQSTLVLIVVNVLFIVLAISFQDIGNSKLLGMLSLGILTINGSLSLYIERFKRTLLNREKSEPVVIKSVPVHAKKSFGEEILEKITEN